MVIEEGLEEEVSTRISRDGELGEGDDLYALSICFASEGFDTANIVGAVSDSHERRSGRYFDESILHLVNISNVKGRR